MGVDVNNAWPLTCKASCLKKNRVTSLDFGIWLCIVGVTESVRGFPTGIDVETRLKGYKYFEIERDFFNKLGVLIDRDFKFGVLLLVFVRFLAVIQAIYIEMVFCKESMSVPFSSFPWILASRESGQSIVYLI